VKKAVLAAAFAAALLSAGPAAADTVTISGRAYAFNHMDTFLAGATIKVREIPGLEATADANGDYSLTVPDDTNVTPYIDPPAGYNEIDLQTFHPRGEDIVNANFQTPGDAEYAGLAAILSVPLDEETGRPQQCAIVTTASARNVRGVDYETFHANTPHGVPGATSVEFPALDGPIYFNEFVIPDASRTETSEDGGIVWTEVPAGSYRIETTSPDTRFASFLATCRDGRVVNANPPWGAYELSPGEQPLGAGVVASAATEVGTKGSGERRKVVATLDSGEAVHVNAVIRKGGKRVGHTRIDRLPIGVKRVKIKVRKAAGRGKARLDLKLRDAAGDVVSTDHPVRIPAA
jgi:hypothetical protein